MENNKVNWIFIVVLSCAWICKPISYQDMRFQHSSIVAKTQSKTKSSPVSTNFLGNQKINELELLEKNDIAVLTSQKTQKRPTEEITPTPGPLQTQFPTTRRVDGRPSIFVEGLTVRRQYLSRPGYLLNTYDRSLNLNIKRDVMLKAHENCSTSLQKLPRKIIRKDRKVKFGSKFIEIFRKTYTPIFEYDLLMEQNIGVDAPSSEVKAAEKKLYKQYGKAAKKYLRKTLFQNPMVFKFENCKYNGDRSEKNDCVTLYYDVLRDIYAVVSEKNRLLDVNIASEIKFAEIFGYKSIDSVNSLQMIDFTDLLNGNENPVIRLRPDREVVKLPENPEVVQLSPNEVEDPVFPQPFDIPKKKSKVVDLLEEDKWLTKNEALELLRDEYLGNYILIGDNYTMDEWQACKKIKHAPSFGINLADYGFDQKRAVYMTTIKGGLTAYVQRNGIEGLPSKELIHAFQRAVKKFCENENHSPRSERPQPTIHGGQAAIIFENENQQKIVGFNEETKSFISAQKLRDSQWQSFVKTGVIGNAEF